MQERLGTGPAPSWSPGPHGSPGRESIYYLEPHDPLSQGVFAKRPPQHRLCHHVLRAVRSLASFNRPGRTAGDKSSRTAMSLCGELETSSRTARQTPFEARPEQRLAVINRERRGVLLRDGRRRTRLRRSGCPRRCVGLRPRRGCRYRRHPSLAPLRRDADGRTAPPIRHGAGPLHGNDRCRTLNYIHEKHRIECTR